MGNTNDNLIKRQINVNNPQRQPKINSSINQSSEQYNPLSQKEIDIYNQTIPQQDGTNNSNDLISQNNPNMQQQSFYQINPQIINNNEMMNINSITQILLQHQFLALQRMKHQMILAQIANSQPQMNNIILNDKVQDGEINDLENSK